MANAPIANNSQRYKFTHQLDVGEEFLPPLSTSSAAPNYGIGAHRANPTTGILEYWNGTVWTPYNVGNTSFVSSDGDLTKAQRLGNTLIGVKDRYTGEYISFNKVTLFYDNTAMSDAKVDGIMYIKVGTEYFLRQTDGWVNVGWWGAKAEYVSSASPGTNNATAFQAAISYASLDTNHQRVIVPMGNWYINSGLSITGSNVIVAGLENRSRIYMGSGVTSGIAISGSQYVGIYALNLYTLSTNTTTAHALYPSTSPNSTFKDIRIEGNYTGAAVRHGVDSWGCEYYNVRANNITGGNGWWFREGNTNELRVIKCWAKNCTSAAAISVSQFTDGVIDEFSMEGNSVGAFEFRGVSGASCFIRGLYIKNLYFEQNTGSSIPVFKITHTGGVMSARDIHVRGGTARCEGGYYADLRGITASGGTSAGFDITFDDISITNVTNYAFIWDSLISGRINNSRPYDRSTLAQQNLIDPSNLATLGKVSVTQRQSTGVESLFQQVNLGPKNTAIAADGSLFYTSPNMQYYDATAAKDRTLQVKGRSYIISTSATYVADDILGGANINAGATAGAVTVTLPAVSTVDGNTYVTVKKTDVSVNPVTVARGGSDTIDGVTTFILYQRYDFVTFVYDGTSALLRIVSTNVSTKFYQGIITAATYTSQFKDEYMECSCALNAIAITLQKASTLPQGTIKYIRKIDSSANAVTFVLDAADVANSNPISLTKQNDYIILMRCLATSWRLVGGSSNTGVQVTSGTGSPEGVVTGPVGSEYTDTTGTPGNIKWIKQSGTGNTGWGPIA